MISFITTISQLVACQWEKAVAINPKTLSERACRWLSWGYDLIISSDSLINRMLLI